MLHFPKGGRGDREGLIVAVKDHKPFLLATLCLQNSLLPFKESMGSQTNTYHTTLTALWRAKLAGGTIHRHIKEKVAFSAPHRLCHSSFLQAGQSLVHLVCSCSERAAPFQAWPRCHLQETQPDTRWKLLGQWEKGRFPCSMTRWYIGMPHQCGKALWLQASPSLGDLMTAKLWRQKPHSCAAYSQSHLANNFLNYCLEKSSSKMAFLILLMKNNKNQQLKTSLDGALEKNTCHYFMGFPNELIWIRSDLSKGKCQYQLYFKAVSLLRYGIKLNFLIKLISFKVSDGLMNLVTT